MLRHFSWPRLAALFVVLITPTLVRAQTLADRLPPDAIVYVGWRGVESPGPGFEGSHLQAVLAESNLPKVVDEFLPKVLDRIAAEDRKAAEVIGIVRALLGPMWRHPTAYAFAGFDIDPKTGPKPKFVLLCQAGNEAAALKTKIDDLLKLAPPPPFPLHVVLQGDLLAFVVGYDKVEDGVPAAGGMSLANNPEFVKSLAQVSKDGVVTVYTDVERYVGLIDSIFQMAPLPPDIQKIWPVIRDKLGVKSIKRVIVTAGFDGKDWATRAFVSAPAPRTGLIGSLLEGKPLSKEVLASIPQNATVAGATHFDIAGLVDALRTGVSNFDPHTGKKIDEAFDQVNQMLGMDVQKDLLGALGDEWCYYCDPAVAGNGIVGATLVNRLKDPDKAKASLEKLEQFINAFTAQQLRREKVTIAFREVKIGEATVHYLAIPLVTPAWAVQNGNLYIALYPETVGAAAGQVPGKSKSIMDNPAFATTFQRLGDHPVSSFQFLDVPKMAPEYYSTWLVLSHLANAGDLFGVPAPVMIIPPLEKLTPHLSASGQIAWTDADGAHFSSITSFPGSSLFGTNAGTIGIAEAALITSIMMPALSKVRGEANRAKSAANLRQIFSGAIQYANAHNGNYPKQLSELHTEVGYPLGIFVNPSSNTVSPVGLPPEQAKEWIDEHCDYVWNGRGRRQSDFGQDDAIAWEKPQPGGRGLNIAFGDGHIMYYSMFEATEIIRKATAPK